MYIEGKYKDAVKTSNYCRIMFFANRLHAFPVEQGARRPHIINCSKEKLPKYIGAEASKAYFDALGKAISNKYVQKLFYDKLMAFDITNFNHNEVEKSELHKTLEEASKSPMVEFLSKIVYNNKNKESYKSKTTVLLKMYNNFIKERGMQFTVNQKNLMQS